MLLLLKENVNVELLDILSDNVSRLTLENVNGFLDLSKRLALSLLFVCNSIAF